MFSLIFLASTRSVIVGMHRAGRNTAQIAKEIGCSTKTVRLWINRHDRGGLFALEALRKFNHPPRKTSAIQDEVINEYFTDDNPFSTPARFVNLVHADVCNDTIRRRLNEMGIRS